MKLSQIYLVALIATIICCVVLFSGRAKSLENIFQKCWVGEGKDWFNLGKWRGKNYTLTLSGAMKKYCFMTSWAITHLILYAIIGFFFPKMFWTAFLVGVLFELSEWFLLDCHDVLDLFWNSLGFFIGAGAKVLLC